MKSDKWPLFSILFQILFPFRLLQNTEQSSLCCTIGLCWLPILLLLFFFKKGKFALFQMLSTGEEGRCLSKAQLPPTTPTPAPNNQRARALTGNWGKGATCISSDWSLVIWPASSWLFLVQLIFSSTVSLFPFLWGQFSELWQHMSRPPSGHHVVNYFHLARVSVAIKRLTRYGSEYYLWPLRRN